MTDPTATIIDRINSLYDRLHLAVYFGRDYTGYTSRDTGLYWSATLRFREGKTSLEITRDGTSPIEAITACWNALQDIAGGGLSAGALLPSVSQAQALEDRTDELQ